MKMKAVWSIYAAAVFLATAAAFYKTETAEVFEDKNPKAYLAIIIDDFGYGGEGTEEMLALDADITAAVMPFSEKSAQEVEKIKNSGKEMIVHMPMESLTGKKSWVGDKGVFTNMTDEEIHKAVEEALVIVDGAVGLNNHMGSAIMENERCLKAVLDIVKERNLIFIDSATTPKSLGKKLSEEKEICFLKRDVFLDSTDDINLVRERLRQAGEKALKNGRAVAIGHVGPEGGKITARAIGELKKELEDKGIELVSVSKMKEIYESGEDNNRICP